MKEQYKQVRKQYPAWTRSMVLHYLAGWNGVTLGQVKTTLLTELRSHELARTVVYVREAGINIDAAWPRDSKGE